MRNIAHCNLVSNENSVTIEDSETNKVELNLIIPDSIVELSQTENISLVKSDGNDTVIATYTFSNLETNEINQVVFGESDDYTAGTIKFHISATDYTSSDIVFYISQSLSHSSDKVYIEYGNSKFNIKKTHGGSSSGDTLPIGSIVEYEGITVPSGYEEVHIDYLEAGPSSNQTLSSEYQQLTLGQNIKYGTRLSVENNTIIIGSGIKKVRISGVLFLENIYSSNAYVWVLLRKNGNDIDSFIMSGVPNYYNSVSIHDRIVEVNQNDYFDIYINKVGSENPIVRSGLSHSRLQIEVVE